MNFLIFVIGVVLAIHGVTKVYGRTVLEYDNSGDENNNDLPQEEEEASWLSMLKRAEILSMATRELEFTEDEYLLKEIISVLDKNIKEDFVRVLTGLDKEQREMVGVILTKLALQKTKKCPRLSKAMTPAQKFALTILYPVAKMLYNDAVLIKLGDSDQQVLKSAEQNIKTNAHLLCK